MNKAQQSHYESLYEKHVNALIRQGKAESTIDVYFRAIRRVTDYYDQSPDQCRQSLAKLTLSFKKGD